MRKLSEGNEELKGQTLRLGVGCVGVGQAGLGPETVGSGGGSGGAWGLGLPAAAPAGHG